MTAFERAWLVVKGIPWKGDWQDSQPIGILGNKKVVLHNGVPYYQSTGSSKSMWDGKPTYKREGGWYGFGGIDTAEKFNMGSNWWIKGDHPDIPSHANLSQSAVYDDELGQMVWEPDEAGQSLGNLANRNQDYQWEQLQDGHTLNQRLADRGWNQ